MEWDAETYAQKFSFVARYGEGLVEMIHGEGLSVLDLGCGDGSLTQLIAQKGHHVLGLDASPDLVKRARDHYPELQFVLADAVEMEVPGESFDVVFSNAVLHWIPREKQSVVLSRIFCALKPGGRFIFELGGYGNTDSVHAALRCEMERRGLNYTMPFYFPTIGEYAQLVEQSGLLMRKAILFDRPTLLANPDGLRNWINMFVQDPFNGISPAVKSQIITAVVEQLRPSLYRDGTWCIDYVRLRGEAERPA